MRSSWPVCPWIIGFGEAMLDTMFGTDSVKQKWEGVEVIGTVSELNSIVGQDGVDFVGNISNQTTQEVSGDGSSHALVQPSKGKLTGAVYGDKQVQFTFLCLNFSDVEVKIAYWVLLKTDFLGGLVTHLSQPTNPVPLQTAMQS
jgi:hypothetical protein